MQLPLRHGRMCGGLRWSSTRPNASGLILALVFICDPILNTVLCEYFPLRHGRTGGGLRWLSTTTHIQACV